MANSQERLQHAMQQSANVIRDSKTINGPYMHDLIVDIFGALAFRNGLMDCDDYCAYIDRNRSESADATPEARIAALETKNDELRAALASTKSSLKFFSEMYH